MKRNERQLADALDQYLNDLRAGKQVTPPTPEAEMAAELTNLLNQVRPTPSVQSPSSLSDELKEPRTMITARNPSASDWMLPLVATLLMMLFVLLLVVKPPQGSLPIMAPPQQEAVKRLPIPVGGVVRELDTAAIEWMHAAGMEWVAYNLRYERENNTQALEQISQLIDDTHAQNFKVFLTIGGAAPEMGADDAVAAYADFVGQAAALGADAIEVWYEPNLERASEQPPLDPANYVALLSASYTAIKAANPDTLVISAGAAPTEASSDFPGRVINDDDYYQGMAEAGAAEFADCIGVHYLEGILPPTATSGDTRGESATRYLVPTLQRAGAAFRESGLPFCITEFGYLTPEGLDYPLSPWFEWANDTTLDQQAEWLASGIQTAAQLSSIRVQMIIVYHVNYNVNYINDPDSAGFAILRSDGTCPACNSIAALREY